MIVSRRIGGVCLGLGLFAAAASAEPPRAVRPLQVPPELAAPPLVPSAAPVAGGESAMTLQGAPAPAAAPPSPPEAMVAVADPNPDAGKPAALRRPAPQALTIDPAKTGYAFAAPAVLVRQLVFGLAHGVTLLARACLDDQEEVRRPTQVAYEEWLMRHGARIIDAENALARYYFGDRAGDAGEDDIARALNLPAQLELRSRPQQLREACASFPEALAKQRYDLDLVFATHRDEQRLGRALELRETVAQCRQIAEAETLPAIDAAFARWQAVNAKVENVALARWLQFRGDLKDLDRWQDDVRTRVRRSFTRASDDPKAFCAALTGTLEAPENSLAQLLGDAGTPAAATAGVVDQGDFANE